jgi:hypothetical protein
MNGLGLRQLAIQARDRRGAEARMVAQRIASFMQGDGLSRSDYRTIVAEVVARLRTQLASDFDLYCRCMGAFPALVKASLIMLAADRGPRTAGLASTEAVGSEPAPWEDEDLDLVEYEWYFDAPSVQKILSFFPAGTSSVVSLSVPTIAAGAASLGHHVTLLDRSQGLALRDLGLRNNRARKLIEVVRTDLGKAIYQQAGEADVVVMDPPWYLEHYRAWLQTAVVASKVGGLLALPLPQLLTNRRSLAERTELLRILHRIGPVKIQEDALSYVTPSFERAVLAIDKLEDLDRWRHADLALVQVQNRHLPYEFEPVADLDWKYRQASKRVIRTWGEPHDRHRPPVTGQLPVAGQLPVIEPADPVHGYRLTSISRNYLASSRINFVTSRGRAAVVSHWGALPEILDSLQDDIKLGKAIDYALPDASPADRAVLAETISKLLER